MNTKNLTAEEYRAAIFGMMLGDASASTRNNKTGLMSITHSIQQKEYLLFKQDIINQDKNRKAKIRKRITRLDDKEFEQFIVETSTSKFGAFLKRTFYNTEGKRVIKKSMLRRLNDFSIFLWYLDDGYLNIRYKDGKLREYRIYIYTQSFTYDDVKKLQSFFETKYNISPNINKKGDGFVLYFNSTKTRAFMQIVEKYKDLVPSMKYKFLSSHNLL